MITKNALNAALSVYDIESECIDRMRDFIDTENLSKAVEILIAAERIGAIGCGHSGIACQHFAHLMCCIEKSAKFISPSEAIHGGMGFLKEGDAMLFVSRGGATKELFSVYDICKEKGIKIITITENLQSPLALSADVVLKLFVNRETDKYNMQGTTSTVASCVLFHVLQTAMIEQMNYQSETFALIHPGGAVGERLNNK